MSRGKNKLLLSRPFGRKFVVSTAAAYLAAPYKISMTATAALSTTASFSLRDPSLLPIQNGGGKTFDVLDPAASDEDGTAVIAKVHAMSQDDAKQMIQKSADALKPWRDDTTAFLRSQVLTKWSNLIKDNADDIGE